MKNFILLTVLSFFSFTSQVMGQSWNIGGNYSTNAGIHFLGTTDNQDLVFRRNNVRAGLLHLTNTSFGVNALPNSPQGSNTAIGAEALFTNSWGGSNTGVGYKALRSNTEGGFNTAIGEAALFSNTMGNYNTATGRFALYYNTTGGSNTAYGVEALHRNTLGDANTATGTWSLNSNNTGSFNTANGHGALRSNTAGSSNTAIGRYALLSNTLGNNNVAIGREALYSNITGNGNVALGYQAGYSETGSNKLHIANSNTTTPLIWGDFATKNLKFNVNGTAASNVEINGIAGASGLKFTNLTSVSPANGFALSVNASGDVIKVPNIIYTAGTGVTITPNNQIHTKWTYFGANLYSNIPEQEQVYIGVQYPPNPGNAKVTVESVTHKNALYVKNNNVIYMDNAACLGEANTTPGFGIGGYFKGGWIGTKGESICNGGTSNESIGVDGLAENSYGIPNPTNPNISSIGVRGDGRTNNGSVYSVGVYGTAYNGGNNNNAWAVYANGKTFSTSGTTWQSSDERLKENIHQVDNALEIINKLDAKTYHFKKDGKFALVNLPTEKQYGFLAQDLEKVIPEMVITAPLVFHKDEKGNEEFIEDYKAVNYTALIPILTQAIKEQQVQIAELKAQVESNNSLSDAKHANTAMISTMTYSLKQNNPNPFDQNTYIEFEVGNNFRNALIAIYDLNGKQLKSYNVTGTNSLEIQAKEFGAGMYIYSLIADNKLLDSKRMVITD